MGQQLSGTTCKTIAICRERIGFENRQADPRSLLAAQDSGQHFAAGRTRWMVVGAAGRIDALCGLEDLAEKVEIGGRLQGFVKLRRGILEHLPDRITADECLCYTLIILMADHRSGAWRGCAQAMARKTGWSVRQCQVVLKSLRQKGYITGQPTTGRGQYLIRVVKYFHKAHGDALYTPEGAPGCALRPQKAHGDATYQEVLQEELHKKKPAQPRRGHSPELIRQIEAKQRRLEKEADAWREGQVGRNWMSDQLEEWRKAKAL